MTHDDRLPDGLRSEARRYNEPPRLTGADLDAMWTTIESASFPAPVAAPRRPAARLAPARFWVPLAAALLLGVAIGRYSVPRPRPDAVLHLAAGQAPRDSVSLEEPYQHTTSQYLGQAAALLVALPAGLREARRDSPYLGRAHDLLLTTRLLLDSPAARAPRFRELLDDLELVFAQVVRLQSAQGSEELELIREALEQRDVLPRLRSAVANISAD